jgi:hypothetical protein
MPVNNYKGVSFKIHYATAYEEYCRQMLTLLSFIAAQTRLPLHDLR